MTSPSCSPETFRFPSDLFGAQGLSIAARPVVNYTAFAQTHPETQQIKGPLSFCNVTVTYTHPGQNDRINVHVWLPDAAKWDGRYVSVGGGGYATGEPDGDLMAYHIANNRAVATTDGGHFGGGFDAAWALASPGNIDYTALNNFAADALDDLGPIGKAIATQYAGSRPPKYAYWHGCSMGGRQGHLMAQTNPEAYHGILANAPALGAHLGPAYLWPQVVMNTTGVFPPPCEFDALMAAAMAACDGLDGVRDGIVARPDLCSFDATALIGRPVTCNGVRRPLSSSAAAAANAFWRGSAQRLWVGMPIGTPLQELQIGLALLNTRCETPSGQGCRGELNPLFMSLVRYLVKKDPSYNPVTLGEAEFEALLRAARQQLYSLLGTDDADLSLFRRAGGKMLTFHGLADPLISPRISRDYVEAVKKRDGRYQDYFRFFEMPGVSHCRGGPGAYPLKAFETLVSWVEQKTAPDSVQALDQASLARADVAGAAQRLLCAYPKVARFNGGDANKSTSYSCVSTPGGGGASAP